MDDAGLFGGGLMMVVWLAIAVLTIVSMWKIFEKAGEPGWAAIVPIYNIVILLKIIDKPIWWIVLLLIPLVNIVMLFIVNIELAKKFGKDVGFGIGMALLGFIFYPMLAFSDAQYQGHDPSAPAMATARV